MDERAKPLVALAIWAAPVEGFETAPKDELRESLDPRFGNEEFTRKVSTDFSGTNSKKIDKLIATAIGLKVRIRICFAIIGLGFPAILSLLGFLVVLSFNTSAKVDRLIDQIAVVNSQYSRLS